MPQRFVISDYDEYNNPAPAVGTKLVPGTVFTQASGAITTSATGADLSVGQYRELAVDLNISAVSGTSPTYQLTINRKGSDGVYYQVYQSSSLTAAGKTSVTIGVGASTNVGFGDIIQIVETIGGTTPSFTRSISLKGK